jgi:hypothetical protein
MRGQNVGRFARPMLPEDRLLDDGQRSGVMGSPVRFRGALDDSAYELTLAGVNSSIHKSPCVAELSRRAPFAQLTRCGGVSIFRLTAQRGDDLGVRGYRIGTAGICGDFSRPLHPRGPVAERLIVWGLGS